MNKIEKFRKAKIGEGLASCDICGKIDNSEKFYVIQIGPEPDQYIEVDKRCIKKIR